MREADRSSRKHISQQKKHSVSEKTRSDNPSQNGKEQPHSALPSRPMKSQGKKYVQDSLFKGKEKQHHEIVISDELVRNSKQYRMLREKIELGDALFQKQTALLNSTRQVLLQNIAANRTSSHNRKLALWELKNQILELKGILNDEEEEGRRLEAELQAQEQEFEGQEQEEEREEEMEEGEGVLPQPSKGQEEEEEELQQPVSLRKGEWLEGSSQINLLMVQLKEEGLNPQQLKKEKEKEQLHQPRLV